MLVITVLGAAMAFAIAGLGVWIWSATRPLPGKNIQIPDWVEHDFLSVNQYSRPGQALKKIKALVIHSVEIGRAHV